MKGAYNVLISMIVVAVMLPFISLFASLISLSGVAPVPGEFNVPGGRPTLIIMALIGLATTLGSIALAFVPAAEDAHPLLSACKVVGMAAALLMTGAVVYRLGRGRAGDSSVVLHN